MLFTHCMERSWGHFPCLQLIREQRLSESKLDGVRTDNPKSLSKATKYLVICSGKGWCKKRKAALTAMILTKSFSPSVSKMVTMVCFAMVIRRPFILPLMSTTITISLGDVAAWMYLRRNRKAEAMQTKQMCKWEKGDNSDHPLEAQVEEIMNHWY